MASDGFRFESGGEVVVVKCVEVLDMRGVELVVRVHPLDANFLRAAAQTAATSTPTKASE